MADWSLSFLRDVFSLFAVGGAMLGLSLVYLAAATVVQMALERTLCIASMLEAARELNRQGRAVWLRRWIVWGRRNGQE
jgi:hypothetical protein